MRLSGIFAQKNILKINVGFNSAYYQRPCTHIFYHKIHFMSIKNPVIDGIYSNKYHGLLLIH